MSSTWVIAEPVWQQLAAVDSVEIGQQKMLRDSGPRNNQKQPRSSPSHRFPKSQEGDRQIQEYFRALESLHDRVHKSSLLENWNVTVAKETIEWDVL